MDTVLVYYKLDVGEERVSNPSFTDTINKDVPDLSSVH